MADETTSGASEAASTEIETKARSHGWVPETEWRGDKAKWIPASEYVQRTEQIVNVVKTENRRLHETNDQLNARLAASEARVNELSTSVEALKNFNTEVSEERVRALRTKISKEIKEAREAGDVETELELTGQLNTATRALETSKERKTTPATNTGAAATGAAPVVDPEWAAENKWFGTDEPRSDYAMGVAQRIRVKHPNLVGRAFLNKVSEEVLKAMPLTNPDRGAPSKVEGGSNGAGGGGAGSGGAKTKTYADLPADARAVCDRFAKTLVGPTKVYKTEAEFQKHYVSQYDFS